MIFVLIAVVAIIVGGYATLISYTGMGTPFSVVMSQSMQHDPDRSEIGYIDTGDVVVVKNKNSATIESYVVATNTRYSTFGDYGSVIIYERDSSSNPVIHRAIVWLDWNPTTETWSSKELVDYKGEWYCNVNGSHENNTNNLRGTLTFENLTQSGKTVKINLSTLERQSGYLTLGDNPKTNLSFDQTSGIISHPIGNDDIRSVPFFEIPWLGTIKLLINGNNANLSYVPNSLPSLAMVIVTIIGAILLIDVATVWKNINGWPFRKKEDP
jgi:signal peptidase